MFLNLQYDVTFPNGRKLANDLTFEAGFHALTGANETGKSFTLEMLRFLLFGSAALRGEADDYKTLRASGSFLIKGESYAISRTMRKAELKRGDEVVASGVTPVNAKIVQLLGFGLLVFDTACSINQGEVERLGAMKATERKRLVDSVLGIDALDVVAKWGMDEARVLGSQAEMIRASLKAPTPPTQPEPYRPGLDIARIRAEAREAAEIDGWLAHTRARPVEPVLVAPVDLEALAAKRSLRERIAQWKARVGALPASAPYSEAELAQAEADWSAYDAFMQAQGWLRSHPRPKHHLMQLRVFQDDHTALENIQARAALASRIEGLKAKGAKPCPHCGEDIAVENDAIVALEAQHDALVVPNGDVTPPKPPLSRGEIEVQLHYLREFDEPTWREMSAVAEVARPTIARERISTFRAAIDQVAEREALLPALQDAEKAFEAMPDYDGQLAERRAYEAAQSRYEADLESFELWDHERNLKLTRRGEIVLDPEAERDYLAARDFDLAQARFGEAVLAFDAKVAEADELEAQAAKHRKVRELMAVLRSLIKQHLMPSLNRVASHLLTGMTGGQRTSILVDEEFNVLVDGQRLETLSGSGKACANLALRIALGQVLTNRVISVLLADEIDASMDDFRAQQTSDVLHTLEKSISQVILVSHKSVEATNHIRLGDFFGSPPSDAV